MRLFRIGSYAIDLDDVLWIQQVKEESQYPAGAVVICFRSPAGEKERLVLYREDADAARAFLAHVPDAAPPEASHNVAYAQGELTITSDRKAASRE
jgi:hypothetical protein